MMNQTPEDWKTTRQQRPKKRNKEASLLGEVLSGVMSERIGPKHEQTEALLRAWAEVLPEELANHCRIEDISAGVLVVTVDGPGYMHELRLCKKELCDEMNRMVEGAKIRDIKLSINR